MKVSIREWLLEDIQDRKKFDRRGQVYLAAHYRLSWDYQKIFEELLTTRKPLN